jgi:hypothetical protein
LVRIDVRDDVNSADFGAVALGAMNDFWEVPGFNRRASAIGPYVDDPRDTVDEMIRFLPTREPVERPPNMLARVIYETAADTEWLSTTGEGFDAQHQLDDGDWTYIMAYIGREAMSQMFTGNYSDAWSDDDIVAVRPVLGARGLPYGAEFLYEFGYSDIHPFVTLNGMWNTYADIDNIWDVISSIPTLQDEFITALGSPENFTEEDMQVYIEEENLRRLVERGERFDNIDDILSYLLLTTVWGSVILETMDLQNFMHLFTQTPYNVPMFVTARNPTIGDLYQAYLDAFEGRIDELFPTAEDRQFIEVGGTYVQDLLDRIDQ